jgi:hypothetical protein
VIHKYPEAFSNRNETENRDRNKHSDCNKASKRRQKMHDEGERDCATRISKAEYGRYLKLVSEESENRNA